MAQIPEPPVDSSVMPQDAQAAFTVVTGVPMLIVLAIAVAHLLRGKGPLLFYCCVGGGLASFVEPVADVLCQLYFPPIDQATAFETLGRPIPWFLVFAYPWFVGAQGYLVYRLLERGITRSQIMLLWLSFIASNILVEAPGLLMGAYTYYGTQPFYMPWGFPLWMGFVQGFIPLAAGALLYAVRSQLGSAWRSLVAIPLLIIADSMTYGGLSLPAWSTLNSNASLTVNYVGATLTIGLAAVAVWLLTVVLARPRAGDGVHTVETAEPARSGSVTAGHA